MKRTSYRAGILGATGAVGQKFVELLLDHPWFEITALAASERSAGRTYEDAASWMGACELPEHIARMEVQETTPDLPCDFVFSGLSSSVAGDVETAFAKAGYPVISNARNHRMRDDVPLIIPEINPDHLGLIAAQDDGDGFIVTNPNCSTVGLACALQPLEENFGVEAVQVTTLQALSGAGYPGVPSLDAVGNVIPFIGGEEDKLASEPLKILGTFDGESVRPAEIAISAQCNRVPVVDGHTECVSVKLAEPADAAAVRRAIEAFQSPIADEQLPSAPEKLFYIHESEDGPQPRRHTHLGKGMTISIGRIRPCDVLDMKFVVLVHNTIRGAAGVAVLNAELLAKRGYLERRKSMVMEA